MSTRKLNQKGVTLVGTLVSVVIAGIVLTALLSASVYSFQSQRNVRLTSNFVDLMNEAKITLENGVNSNCTRNVAEAIKKYKQAHGEINFNTLSYSNPDALPKLPLTLSYFKQNGTPDTEVLAPGMTIQDIEIGEMFIQPKAQIAAGKVMFDVNIKAEKLGEVLGSKQMAHKISVLGTISDNGDFVSCGAGGSTVEEKVCGLLAEGSWAYNPKTGKCVKTTEIRCFAGSNAETASCPANAKRWGCDSTAEETDWSGKSRRDYNDGAYLESNADHFVCRPGETDSSVKCVYAADYAVPGGTVCSACCEVSVLNPDGSAIVTPGDEEGAGKAAEGGAKPLKGSSK